MNKSFFKQLFSYCLVGFLGTLVELGLYYLLDPVLHFSSYLAVAVSFLAATFVNWLAGRRITFRHAAKQPIARELLSIYSVSMVGLLLNELIMMLLLRVVFPKPRNRDKLLAKVLAAALVFFYNFFVRRLVIYRKEAPAAGS